MAANVPVTGVGDSDDELVNPTGAAGSGQVPANPFSPGSPAASPQSQSLAVSAQDMMLMMQQMMQATQAATRAAEAAASAVQRDNKQGIGGSDMARILPRPDVFKPASREEEHSQWLSWFWSLKQYLGALDSAFSTEVAYLETTPSTEILSYASPESEQRSKQLYSLLASLVKGRGLQVIQRIPMQNGFEALRQLMQLFQPTSRTRSLGILSALTSMSAFKGNEPLLPQVLDMERIIDEYERSSSKKLDDDFKSSIFLRSLPNSMRNHLATILTEDVTYDELREACLRFERMSLRWDSRNLFADSNLFGAKSKHDGPVAMEVDAVQKGKAKGKGKGSKGQPGRGKGKQQDSKGQQHQKGAKGGNQAKGKGKGQQQQKGGKGGNQPKGKGKGQQAPAHIICHNCHRPGHYARDCWRNVQQVQQGQVEPSIASTAAPSAAGPSVSQAGQAKNVHRVEIDMTTDDFSSFACGSASPSVRAVQQVESGCRVEIGAEGSLGFLGIVRSLTHSQHSTPQLPNLKPVHEIAQQVAIVEFQQPAVFNMAYSDDDGEWTSCDDVRTLCVSAVQHEGPDSSQPIQVVVDSGSDASCLPLSWGSVGLSGGKDPNSFKDAQGNPIHSSQTRTATLEIAGTRFKERWLLSSVTQPLFSVGKLLKQGWNIIHDEHVIPHLTSPNGDVRVPMYYQHNSLHAQGIICSISACPEESSDSTATASTGHVRALEITGPWLSLKDEFQEMAPGVYARKDSSTHVIDCSVPLSHLGVQFRTSIKQDHTGWNVVELNQDITLLEQREAEFATGRTHQLITIGSFGRVDVSSLFNRVPPPAPGVSLEAPATDNTAAAGVGDFDDIDEEMYVPDFAGEGALNDDDLPAEPHADDDQAVAEAPGVGHLVVDGVELHEGCTLATLRAACATLGLVGSREARARCSRDWRRTSRSKGCWRPTKCRATPQSYQGSKLLSQSPLWRKGAGAL